MKVKKVSEEPVGPLLEVALNFRRAKFGEIFMLQGEVDRPIRAVLAAEIKEAEREYAEGLESGNHLKLDDAVNHLRAIEWRCGLGTGFTAGPLQLGYSPKRIARMGKVINMGIPTPRCEREKE